MQEHHGFIEKDWWCYVILFSVRKLTDLRIEAYSGTYFALLPLELREILASYRYQCNFIIAWQDRSFHLDMNGVIIKIRLPAHAISVIPELLEIIIQNKMKMILIAGITFYYNKDILSIQTDLTYVTLPVCKVLIDILKSIIPVSMKK